MRSSSNSGTTKRSLQLLHAACSKPRKERCSLTLAQTEVAEKRDGEKSTKDRSERETCTGPSLRESSFIASLRGSRQYTSCLLARVSARRFLTSLYNNAPATVSPARRVRAARRESYGLRSHAMQKGEPGVSLLRLPACVSQDAPLLGVLGRFFASRGATLGVSHTFSSRERGRES